MNKVHTQASTDFCECCSTTRKETLEALDQIFELGLDDTTTKNTSSAPVDVVCCPDCHLSVNFNSKHCTHCGIVIPEQFWLTWTLDGDLSYLQLCCDQPSDLCFCTNSSKTEDLHDFIMQISDQEETIYTNDQCYNCQWMGEIQCKPLRVLFRDYNDAYRIPLPYSIDKPCKDFQMLSDIPEERWI